MQMGRANATFHARTAVTRPELFVVQKTARTDAIQAADACARKAARTAVIQAAKHAATKSVRMAVNSTQDAPVRAAV